MDIMDNNNNNNKLLIINRLLIMEWDLNNNHNITIMKIMRIMRILILMLLEVKLQLLRVLIRILQKKRVEWVLLILINMILHLSMFKHMIKGDLLIIIRIQVLKVEEPEQLLDNHLEILRMLKKWKRRFKS